MSTTDQHTEKSTDRPGRICPHCGDAFDESLAVHVSKYCRQSTYETRPSTAGFDPHARWDHMPALEDAPETVSLDEDDLAERRQLADRLEETGETPLD